MYPLYVPSCYLQFMKCKALRINAISECPEVSEDPFGSAKIFNFSMMMVISLVGILGNSLVIVTFHKQKHHTSATQFLKALAAFDILLIISTNIFSHRSVDCTIALYSCFLPVIIYRYHLLKEIDNID